SGLEDSGSLSTGEIKLSTGERQVRCTQNLAEKSDMIKIIEVTAEYDYQDSKSTNVLVKHLV
ncbi:hypothetical protein CMO90_00250, partial [Candidatus Woesearchaeota archaeon]|nr:hypothetical protein [Candidatus Woesearchaeota archaeon]